MWGQAQDTGTATPGDKKEDQTQGPAMDLTGQNQKLRRLKAQTPSSEYNCNVPCLGLCT